MKTEFNDLRTEKIIIQFECEKKIGYFLFREQEGQIGYNVPLLRKDYFSNKKGHQRRPFLFFFIPNSYFKCLERCLAISNIDTWPLPPKTAFSFSSALIMRLFFAS